VVRAAHCPHCPGVEESLQHVFIACPRVSALWQQLVARLLPYIGPQEDDDLLFLAWPPTPRDPDLVAILAAYIAIVWAAREARQPATFQALTEVLRARPPPFLPLW